MDWMTWSPFQSAEVKDICAHMTQSERSAAVKRAALYGVWVVISLALPTVLAIRHPSWLALCIATPLVAIHILCIPLWQRKQREFLCSTEWAKSQGLEPHDVKRFARPKR